MRPSLLALGMFVTATLGRWQRGQPIFSMAHSSSKPAPPAITTGPTRPGRASKPSSAQSGGARRFPLLAGHATRRFRLDAGQSQDYLRDPQSKVKGNRMPFSGMANDADIDDLIAYLATLK